MLKYWYSEHKSGTNPRMRVWLDGWASDMFEVLSPSDFAALENAVDNMNTTAKRLNLGEPISLSNYDDITD